MKYIPARINFSGLIDLIHSAGCNGLQNWNCSQCQSLQIRDPLPELKLPIVGAQAAAEGGGHPAAAHPSRPR